jgi:predicted nucleic acid-binding protein
MQRVSAEGLSVVASVMTLTETLTKPLKVGDQVLVQEYRALFRNTRQVRLIPITVQIADLAAQLRARYNLKTPDALQIATAIDARSDLFLTNDLGIKRVTDVRVLPLDELTLD